MTFANDHTQILKYLKKKDLLQGRNFYLTRVEGPTFFLYFILAYFC